MTREKEEEVGRGGKESREEGCMSREFSSRRNGQRRRELKGRIKKKSVSYNPEIFKRMLNVAK